MLKKIHLLVYDNVRGDLLLVADKVVGNLLVYNEVGRDLLFI